jgi:putative transposase
VIKLRGAPRRLSGNNVSEFISTKLKECLDAAKADTLSIELGALWQNGYGERINGRLRDQLLCRNRFADPDEAKRRISEWIERFYNLYRQHTTLGSVSPINYELAWQMQKQRT